MPAAALHLAMESPGLAGACLRSWRRLSPVLFLLLVACGAPDDPEEDADANPACRAPSGVSSRPESVEQTVALANALPKPLTLPCFVEALEKPLQLHASRSVISAQPASGSRSPRIFLALPGLVLTVVPEGSGAALLEMGEQRTGHRSLKAELSFPIVEQIGVAEAFEHTLFASELTSCAFCHAGEELETQASGVSGYVSQALRPYDTERVPLSVLREERRACDPAQELERCALLEALFGSGDAVDWDFPKDMPTFGR
jgi:hypothetical protein